MAKFIVECEREDCEFNICGECEHGGTIHLSMDYFLGGHEAMDCDNYFE